MMSDPQTTVDGGTVAHTARSNVARLPSRKARRSSMICDLNDLAFPKIYLVGRSWSDEDCRRHGLAQKAWAGFSYEFNPEQYRELGKQAFVEVDRIDPHLPISVLVRNHPSEEIALHYLEALRLNHCFVEQGGVLLTPDAAEGALKAPWQEYCCIDGDHFTMHEVPTHPSWPGDLLIYQVQVPYAHDPDYCHLWTRAITPTGERLDLYMGNPD